MPPVKLQQIADHLVAMDQLEPAKARGIAREVVAVLGLLVNAKNDEVYNPAAEPLRIVEDRQRGVRWSGSGGRRR